MFELKTMNPAVFNNWQAERHYLKRKIIKSKMLAHGVFIGRELVGGVLWSTPHFRKKRNLFGMADTLDQWEVLMLARFYLEDGCGLVASQVLATSIGKGHGRGSNRVGWRVQEDWVRGNPPRFPQNPFVPRLLISWSDSKQGHKGTIYKACGWEYWDETNVNYRRTGKNNRDDDAHNGQKTCWIMRLGPNPRAEQLGYTVGSQLPLAVELNGC